MATRIFNHRNNQLNSEFENIYALLNKITTGETTIINQGGGGSVTKQDLDNLNVAFKNEDNNFTVNQTFGQKIIVNGQANFNNQVNLNGNLISSPTSIVSFQGITTFTNAVGFSSSINVSGLATFNSSVNMNSAVSITGAGTVTVSKNMILNGSITTNGTGNFTISKPLILAGTVQVNGSSITLNSSGTMSINRPTQITSTITLLSTLNIGSISGATGTGTIIFQNGTVFKLPSPSASALYEINFSDLRLIDSNLVRAQGLAGTTFSNGEKLVVKNISGFGADLDFS